MTYTIRENWSYENVWEPFEFSHSEARESNTSSSLRPGTKGFTCGKWFIGYNFGIDDGAESKFGTHKELIILNISKY